jgi:hypothetical protein
LLLLLVLRGFEVIIQIVRPHIVVRDWAYCLSPGVHLGCIGSNSLMHYTNINLFLHVLTFHRGLWLRTNYS